MQSSRRDQYVSTVVANEPLCLEHYRLVLRLPSFPPTQPGQFVQIACRDVDPDMTCEREVAWVEGEVLGGWSRELSSPLALLRRPFSLAGRRETGGGVELDIIHRVIGIGTEWLARLAPGEKVDLLGPLGNRFELPEGDSPAILVGGGVGIPPMLYLAERLAGRRAAAFCGAMTRDLLPLTIEHEGSAPTEEDVEPRLQIAEFSRHGLKSVVTTDDGTCGFRGYVTQALERYLDAAGWISTGGKMDARERGPRHGGQAPGAPVIYTCGPEPMMKRVAEIAAGRGLECQVAVERAMACGMGTCQSCVIRVRREDGAGWVYRLACTDGPVFRGEALLW